MYSDSKLTFIRIIKRATIMDLFGKGYEGLTGKGLTGKKSETVINVSLVK